MNNKFKISSFIVLATVLLISIVAASMAINGSNNSDPNKNTYDPAATAKSLMDIYKPQLEAWRAYYRNKFNGGRVVVLMSLRKLADTKWLVYEKFVLKRGGKNKKLIIKGTWEINLPLDRKPSDEELGGELEIPPIDIGGRRLTNFPSPPMRDKILKYKLHAYVAAVSMRRRTVSLSPLPNDEQEPYLIAAPSFDWPLLRTMSMVGSKKRISDFTAKIKTNVKINTVKYRGRSRKPIYHRYSLAQLKKASKKSPFVEVEINWKARPDITVRGLTNTRISTVSLYLGSN